MKKFKKYLALLLAGVLLTTSLIACETNNSTNDGGESDKTNDLLTPEAFTAVIYGDEDMTIVAEWNAVLRGRVTTYTRDGNIVDETNEKEGIYNRQYYDFENGIHYFQNSSGEWVSSESGVKNWKDLVEDDVIPKGMEFFFDNDNYAKKNNRYELTDAGAKAYFDLFKEDSDFTNQVGEHPVLESYFEHKDGSNLFYFALTSEDGQTVNIVLKMTVTLGDTTVTLPEVE